MSKPAPARPTATLRLYDPKAPARPTIKVSFATPAKPRPARPEPLPDPDEPCTPGNLTAADRAVADVFRSLGLDVKEATRRLCNFDSFTIHGKMVSDEERTVIKTFRGLGISLETAVEIWARAVRRG